MTHKHEWHFFENSVDGVFCVKGCHGRLSRKEAERRLNATEELSAEMARGAVDQQINNRVANALRAYAERMEGK